MIFPLLAPVSLLQPPGKPTRYSLSGLLSYPIKFNSIINPSFELSIFLGRKPLKQYAKFVRQPSPPPTPLPEDYQTGQTLGDGDLVWDPNQKIHVIQNDVI